MPYPYHWDHAALMAQGKIYAVGGYIGSEGRAMDQIRAFDPETSEWTDLSPLPASRHHVMASVYPSPANDAFVIVGGIDGELGDHATASAWLYNITSDSISELPNMPRTRAAGAAVTYDGLIYVIGGMQDDGVRPNLSAEVPIPSMMVFDPSTNEWGERDGPPVHLEHIAAAVFDEGIWVVAGRWGWGEGHLEKGEVYIYDRKTMSWHEGPRLNQPRAAHGVVVIDNKYLVTVGGEYDGTPLTSVEFLASSSLCERRESEYQKVRAVLNAPVGVLSLLDRIAQADCDDVRGSDRRWIRGEDLPIAAKATGG
ncbi:unnamed protein product [Vitrella brassicaformis CCMP3155]|uniref:Galactose oxidase n=1 Tax=Vitrella brassicaformis (strain CCMP3155) TaxID=1169540 RepID=A0A0G4H158_VITBC|nr:unnamed protein product [Vitrella brassicaformis CCMP3155]|eukprot:CEM37287.1 unnamed protein product [Vitrella brassicaformis CCMP3155]